MSIDAGIRRLACVVRAFARTQQAGEMDLSKLTDSQLERLEALMHRGNDLLPAEENELESLRAIARMNGAA